MGATAVGVPQSGFEARYELIFGGQLSMRAGEGNRVPTWDGAAGSVKLGFGGRSQCWSCCLFASLITQSMSSVLPARSRSVLEKAVRFACLIRLQRSQRQQTGCMDPPDKARGRPFATAKGHCIGNIPRSPSKHVPSDARRKDCMIATRLNDRSLRTRCRANQ